MKKFYTEQLWHANQKASSSSAAASRGRVSSRQKRKRQSTVVPALVAPELECRAVWGLRFFGIHCDEWQRLLYAANTMTRKRGRAERTTLKAATSLAQVRFKDDIPDLSLEENRDVSDNYVSLLCVVCKDCFEGNGGVEWRGTAGD